LIIWKDNRIVIPRPTHGVDGQSEQQHGVEIGVFHRSRRLADTCEFVKWHLIRTNSANGLQYIFKNYPVIVKQFLILQLHLTRPSEIAVPVPK